ncbi:MAG TPA: glycerol-3-phosphate dehydrogenase [Pyrinomonadaceae bacterium]|nr:glycerol-3-phosphate dehydrogenase [Pyrinomonadaceae bacterium]
MQRAVLSEIEKIPFDVIIIGAGINGAGIARDAAMRGLKVLLLDKGDVSAGTSAWSTRLIHGGLRYLEYGEVALVRESLREREHLFHIAPHLVKPLQLLIPVYPQRARRGRLMIRAGMLAYDILSFDKSLEHHRALSRRETLRRVPMLDPEGLSGAVVYYDAQVEFAERLVLENALSAFEHGAHVLNYARVDKIIVDNNEAQGVLFTDMIQGGTHTARASLTINAAGPWVDEVAGLSDNAAPRMIGGTKGSHIVVGKFTGAPDLALYVEAVEDHRPFFIIPWNGLYLIGTTDTPHEGDLDYLRAEDEEIDYLLKETNRIIPSANLARSSILYTYSGVRPLAYSSDKTSAAITRRHFIHDHSPRLQNFLSIVGGKLTTYRNLAEQAVDEIFRKLKRDAPECLTARELLPGAGNFDSIREKLKAESLLSEKTSARLLRIYGARADEVLKLAESDKKLKEVFSCSTEAIGAEVVMAFEHEMAQTLADCLLRRTMVGLDSFAGLDADEAAARIAAKHLGWSSDRLHEEVAAYRKYIERFRPHGLERIAADENRY